MLKVSRTLYYYQPVPKKSFEDIAKAIETIYIQSYKLYGSRRIKQKLAERGIVVSRRKIAFIMKQKGYISEYNVKSSGDRQQL